MSTSDLHLAPCTMHSNISWPSSDMAVVTVMCASRMIVSSSFIFDHASHKVQPVFNLSKHCDKLVGERSVCSAMANAYTTVLSCSEQMRSYYIASTDVRGKPRNCRVEYATSYLTSIRNAHNEEVMQRRALTGMRMPMRVKGTEVRADGMRVSIRMSSSECDLCMVAKRTYSVTCCTGKFICTECLGRLNVDDRCPWCRR